LVGFQVVPVPLVVVVEVVAVGVVDDAFFFVDPGPVFFDDALLAVVVVVVFVFGPFALLTPPEEVVWPLGEGVVVVLVVLGFPALPDFGAASRFTDRAAAPTSATGNAIHLLIRMDTCPPAVTVEQAPYPFQNRDRRT
jgi:hypothetical protein